MTGVATSIEMAEQAVVGLAGFAHKGLLSQLESIRLARAGYALMSCGCYAGATFPGTGLTTYLIENQQQDGGWADVEETLWCLGYLAAFDNKPSAESVKGLGWLRSVRLPCGAWGRTERDQPRIPITALVSVLAPEAVQRPGLEWVASQWEADLASPTQLTYKGAFFLLSHANARTPVARGLIERTVAYLCQEQEEDGGFAPWRGHPLGSDPWTTGVVLWGLSRFPRIASGDVIKRAVNWLQSKQLANGLWPYHYLDDGTSMALIGLSSILPLLRES